MVKHLGDDLISHSPWRISERGPFQSKDDPVFWNVDIISGGIRVARVSGVGKERALANANLIIASPDMFEAIDLIIARFEMTNINTPIKDMKDEIEILKKARNKAKRLQ